MLEIERFRPHIEAALGYGDNTHTFADVQEMVAAGDAVLWPGPASVIITETIVYPRHKVLNFFLAAGNARELMLMEPHITAWGADNGCQKATLIGRRGWTRNWLPSLGWRQSDLVLMEKALG